MVAGGGTSEVRSGAEASLSPDRSKIAYLRDGSLWVMNSDGSAQRRVLSPKPLQSFYGGELAWSPDGTKLAVNMQYESPCPGPIAANKCWEPSVSGVIVDLDGVVVGGTGLDPAWSPDGKWIVSAVDESGSPDDRDWQIVVSSLDGAPRSGAHAGDPHPGRSLLVEPVVVAGRDVDRGLPPARLRTRVRGRLVAVVPLPGRDRASAGHSSAPPLLCGLRTGRSSPFCASTSTRTAT